MREPIALCSMLSFQTLLRGWREPGRQHDIAEFMAYLLECSQVPFGRRQWQARLQEGILIRTRDAGLLNTPIPITMPDRHDQNVAFQDCVAQFFRGQETLCALTSEVPLLCFQLKRYQRTESGQISKNRSKVWFTEHQVEIPIWEDDGTMRLRLVAYTIKAIAYHIGNTPSAGHYRACLICAGEYYLTDDGVPACAAGDTEIAEVQENSYLFVCVRDDARSHQD